MSVILVRPRASGGLAAHVDQEKHELAAAGVDVREAPVQIQDRPHLLGDLRTVRALRQCVRAAPQPVAVHAHGLRAAALSALALPRRGPVLLAVTLHNRTVGSSLVRTVGRALLQVVVSRANTILAVSPDLAQDAERAGARDVRHAVVPAPERSGGSGDSGASGDVPPGGDRAVGTAAAADAVVVARADGASTTHHGADEGTGTDTVLEVLVVARLAPQKGLHDLLDAAALLRDGAPLRIRVAGDGPLHRELAARIIHEQLPVELLGRRDDVPALLDAADLMVSAALWEGQPVWLQEALRAGRAIIATDAGGTRWVTGEAAQLVPVGDAPALASAIEHHRSSGVRRAAEAASRHRAAQLPTASDMVRQVSQVLSLDRER
ncbi:glycosyltransferase [Brachybacterium tyrofermentans]|uniref:glycosyltransferase n=1 Tax=Brachybacterium tyrofermentans TaxID=47848 RepID=UPI003FCF964A